MPSNKSKLKSLLVLIFIIFLISLVPTSSKNSTESKSQKAKTNNTPVVSSNASTKIQPGYYQVDRFIDGDTISVTMNGHSEKVRLIGVDTPETHKPNTPVQCYGPAAAAYTKNIIGNQKVRLEADSKSTNRDKYNRLLRYVYLPDGTNLNAQLISTGNGFYYPYFPFEKSDEFSKLQEDAKANNRGLWGNCSPTRNDRGGYTSNNLN
jgi:micrococcal nuclease